MAEQEDLSAGVFLPVPRLFRYNISFIDSPLGEFNEILFLG